MINTNTAAYGTFLLRLTLGIMFIAHAALKIFVFTLPGTVQFFQSIGYPGGLAYIVTLAELAGGIFLVLGVYSRWVVLALIPILIGASLAHWDYGWVFSAPNGGWEYPVFLTLAAFVQFLLGDGAFALKRSTAIENI